MTEKKAWTLFAIFGLIIALLFTVIIIAGSRETRHEGVVYLKNFDADELVTTLILCNDGDVDLINVKLKATQKFGNGTSEEKILDIGELSAYSQVSEWHYTPGQLTLIEFSSNNDGWFTLYHGQYGYNTYEYVYHQRENLASLAVFPIIMLIMTVAYIFIYFKSKKVFNTANSPYNYELPQKDVVQKQTQERQSSSNSKQLTWYDGYCKRTTTHSNNGQQKPQNLRYVEQDAQTGIQPQHQQPIHETGLQDNLYDSSKQQKLEATHNSVNQTRLIRTCQNCGEAVAEKKHYCPKCLAPLDDDFTMH